MEVTIIKKTKPGAIIFYCLYIDGKHEESFYELKDAKLKRDAILANQTMREEILVTCDECNGLGELVFPKEKCTKCNGEGEYFSLINN